nr:uncharacterized protein LOC115260971 [Aedes albopictus]
MEENEDVAMTNEMWKFVKEFATVFKPAYIGTKKLQEQTLVMGDLMFLWLDCMLQLEEANCNMANTLIEAMKHRQRALFENKKFLAAIYMDPRLNYAGTEFLSEEEKDMAIEHLLEIWERIKEQVKEQAGNPITLPSTSTAPTTRVEAMLTAKCASSNERKQSIRKKLKQLSLGQRVCSTQDVLQYWESIKKSEPELHALAQIALAVPCTQVSVERSFSALGLILTDRRTKLTDENLSNVLFVKLNKDFFCK